MSDTGPRVIDAVSEPVTAVDAAVDELRSARIVVLPTDTVYGLAARVDDTASIETIHRLKKRPSDRRMAVLVADRAQAELLVHLDADATRLAERFWPGPLTIVVPRRDDQGSAVGDEQTIGVRCPAEPLVRSIASRVGPLAVTSANPHGRPTPATAVAAAEPFPTHLLVIDGGERPGAASTVVTVVDGGLRILRAGPLDEPDLRACIASRGD